MILTEPLVPYRLFNPTNDIEIKLTGSHSKLYQTGSTLSRTKYFFGGIGTHLEMLGPVMPMHLQGEPQESCLHITTLTDI